MGSVIKKIYTVSFKIKVVESAIASGNVSQTARMFNVNVNTVFRWIKEYQKSFSPTKQISNNN